MAGRRGESVTWLRAERLAAGMTQRALAAALGVHRRSVEDWEAGRTTVCPMKAAELRRRVAALKKSRGNSRNLPENRGARRIMGS